MQDSELAREVVSVATYIKDVLDSAWEEGCVPHGEMHAQGENDTAALRHNAGGGRDGGHAGGGWMSCDADAEGNLLFSLQQLDSAIFSTRYKLFFAYAENSAESRTRPGEGGVHSASEQLIASNNLARGSGRKSPPGDREIRTALHSAFGQHGDAGGGREMCIGDGCKGCSGCVQGGERLTGERFQGWERSEASVSEAALLTWGPPMGRFFALFCLQESAAASARRRHLLTPRPEDSQDLISWKLESAAAAAALREMPAPAPGGADGAQQDSRQFPEIKILVERVRFWPIDAERSIYTAKLTVTLVVAFVLSLLATGSG
ncbi:hypothetical protein T484DRAFT_1832218 [Baffinella frigidus]|nr:hypothetical protein T484DRAFT_1832218 [Cryptophyta sp. CCMP2293]